MLPELERYYWDGDFGMRPGITGLWVSGDAADAWRTEALRQRERADGLEGERAELLKRVAERDGWVCELRERAEKAEAELRDERKRSWQQARQAEIARYCNERAVESEWLTIKERNVWVNRARNAEAECLEQARLLGMGGEREAALLGKAERLEAELAALKAEHAAALKQATRDALTEAARVCRNKAHSARRDEDHEGSRYSSECGDEIVQLRDKEGA